MRKYLAAVATPVVSVGRMEVERIDGSDNAFPSMKTRQLRAYSRKHEKDFSESALPSVTEI